jgi:hypothetical protein
MSVSAAERKAGQTWVDAQQFPRFMQGSKAKHQKWDHPDISLQRIIFMVLRYAALRV